MVPVRYRYRLSQCGGADTFLGGSGSHGADSGEVRVGVGFSNKRAALDSGQYCTIFYLQLYLSYPLPVLVLAGNAIFSALLLLDLLMQFLFTSYQSRLRGKTAVTSVYVD